MTLYEAVYGEKRDVSNFRAFCCNAWVYSDKQRREKEKHTARAWAKKATKYGFAENLSVWAF
jgi:hypothetical protein